MTALQNLSSSRSVKYADLLVRIPLSIVGGYFIASLGRWKSFNALMESKAFLVLWLVNAVAALLIITYIRWVTKKLDRKFVWDTDALSRLLLQFLLGWVVSFALAFLLGSLMYRPGDSMWQTGWISLYGLLDGLMLAVVNFYYIFWFFAERDGFFRKKEIFRDPAELSDPILFVTTKERNKVYQRASGVVEVNRSLVSIFRELPPSEYLLFPKNAIIRIDNILRAEEIPTGGANAIMKYPEGHKIYVSERQKFMLNGFF
ncbi:LytTR family transcriptional regulator DNA-binding domain-containing protein [Pedobacter sp. PWIIR3]